MKPANVSGIIALSLLAGSAVALAQDPCDQLLHKAKDRSVEPTSREIAAQQAALCFQMPKGAVEKLHGEIARLDAKLADPQLYAKDPQGAQSAAIERGQLAKKLNDAEEQWLIASEAYEVAHADASEA